VRARRDSQNGTFTQLAARTNHDNRVPAGASYATAARWRHNGIDADADANIYIADVYNNRIRRVDRNNNITTVADTGAYGYSGDGGPAPKGQLAYPRAVAVYTEARSIADINNNRIRKVNSDGTITTATGGGA
jgi:hypothetical protein